jgi:tripartite-type tricarboxylate transporter receptor subunit TctC
MHPSRRKLIGLAAASAAFGVLTPAARAQTYPARPVHLIVGFPAGSGPDIVGRIVGQKLSEQLGQAVVVEDRPGASSNLATADVAHAAPDGYMILMLTTANTINATLYQKLDFDFLRDITPVASIDHEPFLMEVTPSFPAKTLPEFIAYAKANPGKVTMASAGIGSAPHIFGQLFQNLAGLELTHVPYRGNPLPDLLSGQVQLFFGPVQSSIEYVRTGKLRALAATTAKRIDSLPDLPTVAAYVPGYEAEGWLGVGVPKNTPAAIIARLNEAISASIVDDTVKARLASLGDSPWVSSTADFQRFVAADTEKWGKVIRAANVKVEQ